MKIKKVILHPALLLACGNTVLAFGTAEIVAISLNILLVTAITYSRINEVNNKKTKGVSFGILSAVNFFTALSVIYTNFIINDNTELLSYLAALSYLAWGIGHIFAGINEKRSRLSKAIRENPQFYYGIGDMSAVNAGGSINPFSFPFMIIGFIKSVFIGKRFNTKNETIKILDSELTAARLYGVGFFLGAATSFAIPYFLVAQLLWGLAYFQFKKDT